MTESRPWFALPQVHVLVLLMGVVLFSVAPSWVSGLPLKQLLSSDAEFYLCLAQRLHDPSVLIEDKGFEYASQIKPGLENFLHIGMVEFADFLMVSPSSMSIGISIASLMAFVLSIYFLVLKTSGIRLLAFILSLLSIIPVHALGITTLGFQPLGFLPRDTFSAVALVILYWYFQASGKKTSRSLIILFVVCGLLGNLYLLVFAYLAEVLILAEILKDRGIRLRHLQYGLAFVIGALPVLAQGFAMMSDSAPLDSSVLELRHSYMLLFPLSEGALRGIRRELLYCLVVPLLWMAIHRCGTTELKCTARPWGRFVLAAFIATLSGVVIENLFGIWAPHLPRASIFFLLGSMVICGFGLYAIGERAGTRQMKTLCYSVLILVICCQSNLPSLYRYMRWSHDTRDTRKDILEIASWLQIHSGIDERILVPSTAEDDRALTLRAYSQRPVYFSYKDGGVAVMDGELARKWLARFHAQQQILSSMNGEDLLSFMEEKEISLAVLRDSDFPLDSGLEERIVYRGTQHVVLRK